MTFYTLLSVETKFVITFFYSRRKKDKKGDIVQRSGYIVSDKKEEKNKL